MTPSSPDTTRPGRPAQPAPPAGPRNIEGADTPPKRRRLALRRLAGLTAVLAGLCWLVKSLAVLAGGTQAALVFEFAPALQSLSVAALAFAFPARAPRRLVALLAVPAGLAAAGFAVLRPEHIGGNVAILLATLLVLAALFLVGGAVHKQQVLGRWSRLPRRVAFWTVPLVLTGGLLSVWNPRLLEVPLLILGLAWLWLGGLLLARRVKPRKEQARAARRPARRPDPSPDRGATQRPPRSTTGARPGRRQ